MKRFVSAVMAAAMIICMCPAVFAEPKAYISYDFSDFNDIDGQYIDAIEIALYMNILSGYPDGSFKPKNGLTRGAAAKIIANFRDQADYTAQSAPFKDVPTDHTFGGCIAYCASQNIIGGYSDGTFQPANPLTGYAFAKMLLNVIEYTQDSARYTGDSWQNAVFTDAAATGISNLIPTLDKNITREEAAQMWYAAWDYETDHYDDEEDWDDEIEEGVPDLSSPAPNTAVVVVDPIREVKLSVFYLGHSEVTSQGKYRFYLFKPGTDGAYWQRLVLDIDPQINAGQTIQYGRWNGTSSYDAKGLRVVWSRESLSDYFSGGKSLITLTANENGGSHMEGEFEAYPASSIHDIQIYGSFNLNFGEYHGVGGKLYNEVGPGPGLSGSGSSSSGNSSSNVSWDIDDDDDFESEKITVTCPKCNGSKRCPECDGKGYITQKKYSSDYGSGSKSYEAKIKCHLCDGDKKCYYCHGNGVIEV